ncbi:hypothetical protein XENOCAPTIV_006757 [Xenoophorus captivus]|uniref:Uncharacterized protein n=1 Tax=Xenoophorus captivus TaxID=1517983 RepID=A0ABV0RC70_9TELE
MVGSNRFIYYSQNNHSDKVVKVIRGTIKVTWVAGITLRLVQWFFQSGLQSRFIMFKIESFFQSFSNHLPSLSKMCTLPSLKECPLSLKCRWTAGLELMSWLFCVGHSFV